MRRPTSAQPCKKSVKKPKNKPYHQRKHLGSEQIHIFIKRREIMSSILKNRVISEKKKLKDLHGKRRLQYIWDYYKFPLIILCVLLYFVGYIIYGRISHKETTLYIALVNITIGETLTEELTDRFLLDQNLNPSRNQVRFYENLYLTEDESSDTHEYTYASRMKIIASIDGEQMDIVLMNREAFDAFSQNGYLCNLEELLLPEDSMLFSRLRPYMISNTVILEDNSTDLYFDESIPYQSQTEIYPMGLDLSAAVCVRDSGLDNTVYLGIISNSPRKSTAISYLRYLFPEH